MMMPEPGVDDAIDLVGIVFAMMWNGSVLGLAIAAVLSAHYHWRVEGMHNIERARDEPTIVRVVNL